MAYVWLIYSSEDVIRAKHCSRVSPTCSGSCLTSTLYFHIIIIMTAMPSVSKNLEKKHKYFATSATKSTRPSSEARPDTYSTAQRIHEARSGVMTEPNLPALNGKNASFG